VTERDRVYGWLGEVEKLDRTSSEVRVTTDSEVWSDLLSASKLSQTVGHLSLQVAAKLRTDSRLHEAYDTYRYALGIFEDHPPGTYRG